MAQEDSGHLLGVTAKPGQALGRLPSLGNGIDVRGETGQVLGPKPNELEVRMGHSF